MTESSLERDLGRARVLVCAGTGGVGKTTIAAALSLHAAASGRRTLVLTIDPARRLAEALGIDLSGGTPTPIDLEGAGIERTSGGRLDAMMLDPKPTFDRLVHRLTDDPDARTRILGNRIYRHLSEALAGSAEFAAMEQVRGAVESGDYDLVVVDTPPSSHALDFLKAPRRLRAFLEGRFVRALVRPAMSASRFGFQILGRSLSRMMGLIERIAGVGFLDDLSEFLSAIDGLTEGFRERTEDVEEILMGAETRFVLIGGARSASEPGTLEFLEELDELDVSLSAVVLNRIRPWPSPDSASDWLERAGDDLLEADRARLSAALEQAGAENAEEAAESMLEIVREAARERAELEETQEVFRRRATRDDIDFLSVAERPQQIDRLASLLGIGEELFGESIG